MPASMLGFLVITNIGNMCTGSVGEQPSNFSVQWYRKIGLFIFICSVTIYEEVMVGLTMYLNIVAGSV